MRLQETKAESVPYLSRRLSSGSEADFGSGAARLIRYLLNLVYGSRPAEFRSAYGLDESVARLQAATRPSFFLTHGKQAAAGTVSASRVRLQRVIPMMGNAFKPFFFGRFEVRGDGVYLTGHFTMHWFTKVFMTFWLAGVLSIAAMATVVVALTRNGGWLPVLGIFAMFGVGIAFLAFAKSFSESDIAWLSDVMRRALAGVASSMSRLPASAP
jgi:hypothetical protein